jgi:hypothetical protein
MKVLGLVAVMTSLGFSAVTPVAEIETNVTIVSVSGSAGILADA